MRLALDDHAWDIGFQDGEQGKPVTPCPYASGTTESWSCVSGYIEGKAAKYLLGQQTRIATARKNAGGSCAQSRRLLCWSAWTTIAPKCKVRPNISRPRRARRGPRAGRGAEWSEFLMLWNRPPDLASATRARALQFAKAWDVGSGSQADESSSRPAPGN